MVRESVDDEQHDVTPETGTGGDESEYAPVKIEPPSPEFEMQLDGWGSRDQHVPRELLGVVVIWKRSDEI